VTERFDTAAFAWTLSRATCAVDPATGESCRWHHGLWPWLRALGLSTSPARFAEFYRAAFARALAGRRSARVLVSGAADPEMVAQVDLACAACDVVPEVVAIDLCETPLALTRRYAERRGLRALTVRSDVLDYAADARFDVVCSDSFLGQFAPPARERLVARWAALLAPGGTLITVNRLREGADPLRRVAFTSAQAEEFVATVRRAAEGLAAEARPPIDELVAEAARYAQRQGAWPVASAADVETLFERGGFARPRIAVAPIAGQPLRATAPTLAGGAPYARVEARLRP
jgi:SAM-dependent methyltransferase